MLVESTRNDRPSRRPVPCPDENVLVEFLEGIASPETRQVIEGHLDLCERCRSLLSTLSKLAPDDTLPSRAQPTEPEPVLGTAPVRIGEQVAGKYRVDQILGAGGMGMVVAATHLELQQKVALKFMQPRLLQTPEAVERFLREARAVVRLKSEHVGRVLDVGRTEAGASYIVMEYLEGEDLERRIRSQGLLTQEQAADFVIQALEAIAEAHAAGIVHRDLKPANLFVTRGIDGKPFVKVLDFGISKWAADGGVSNPQLTRSQAVIGSPTYMAPEQLVSASKVDGRCDIWSLGCTLFELLTGTTPFHGETLPQLIANILQVPAQTLPAGWATAPIVARCLEKDPAKRYGDAAELAAALEPLAPHRAGSAARIAAVLGKELAPAKPPRALPHVAPWVAAGALALAGLGAWIFRPAAPAVPVAPAAPAAPATMKVAAEPPAPAPQTPPPPPAPAAPARAVHRHKRVSTEDQAFKSWR